MNRLIAFVAVLLACQVGAAAATDEPAAANEPAAPGQRSVDEPSAEEILSGTAPPSEYVTKTKCLLSMQIKRTQVLSDQFILFHVNRSDLWLARLLQRCTGLNPRSKLVFEKRNDRICQWDSVRTIAEEDSAQPQFGPLCILPQFEAVTAEQVEQLKKEIKSARYRKAKQPTP